MPIMIGFSISEKYSSTIELVPCSQFGHAIVVHSLTISREGKGSPNPISIPVGRGTWYRDSRMIFSLATKLISAVVQKTAVRTAQARILLVNSLARDVK